MNLINGIILLFCHRLFIINDVCSKTNDNVCEMNKKSEGL